MCLICQRYKFKSKSQLSRQCWVYRQRCVWYVKDTNSKANHNLGICNCSRWAGVFDMSKIQIQKQITTALSLPYKAFIGVFDMSKIQIQKQITTGMVTVRSWTWCVWYVKDTNSKANHNSLTKSSPNKFGVFDMSKIQIQKQITTSYSCSMMHQ